MPEKPYLFSEILGLSEKEVALECLAVPAVVDLERASK